MQVHELERTRAKARAANTRVARAATERLNRVARKKAQLEQRLVAAERNRRAAMRTRSGSLRRQSSRGPGTPERRGVDNHENLDTCHKRHTAVQTICIRHLPTTRGTNRMILSRVTGPIITVIRPHGSQRLPDDACILNHITTATSLRSTRRQPVTSIAVICGYSQRDECLMNCLNDQ